MRHSFTRELGLAVSAGDLLGCLHDFDTRSGFTITPVVICWSRASAAALQSSAAEVAKLHVLPLSDVRAVAAARPGRSPEFCLRFQWGQEFAPAAAIVYQFSVVALDGRACRVADFYQPPFTRR